MPTLYEAQLRHAKHYEVVLRTAKQFCEQGGDGITRGLSLSDSEWDNIVAGQAWVSAREGEATDRLCSDYADAANFLLQLRPYHYARELIDWLKAGLPAARRVKERGAEISHMGNLGHAYSLRGEQRRAVEYYEQVLAFFRQINDRYHQSSALLGLGNAHSKMDEPERALKYYEQALAVAARRQSAHSGNGAGRHHQYGGGIEAATVQDGRA